MRYDLRTPCRNCPFRSDETRIKFRCRERAEEIAEHAYRHGFPCHLSAETEEMADGEELFVPGPNTQHCVGALLMFALDGNGEWPGIDNDDELLARLHDRLDWDAPVFQSEQDFIDANAGENE